MFHTTGLTKMTTGTSKRMEVKSGIEGSKWFDGGVGFYGAVLSALILEPVIKMEVQQQILSRTDCQNCFIMCNWCFIMSYKGHIKFMVKAGLAKGWLHIWKGK